LKRKGPGKKVYSGRKRTKGKLKEPSKSFQALFNIIPDPTVIVDTKGKILAVNDGSLKLTGFKREELIGKNFLKTGILTLESEPVAVKNLSRRIIGTPPAPYELELLTRDGEKRWGEVNATEIEYGGKPAVLAVFRETTEHKKMEEELRESKAKYEYLSFFFSNILENMSDYVMVMDEDYNLRFLNESAKKLYGEAVGQKCYKVVRDRDTPCYHTGIPCEVHEIIEKGKDYFDDTRLGEATGRISQVRARPIRTAEGKKGIITVGRDVTEEKQAEEKLRESEKRYRTLFEESRDAISIVTREGKFLDVNQAYADLFGYTKEELLKLDVRDTYANPEDREKLQQEIEREGSVKDYEVKRCRKDGREMDCLVTSTSLRADDGSILGYQTIIRDITERKRMEDELRRSKQSLEAIIHNIPDPVFIKTPDSTHVLVNQAYCEFSKRPKEEIIGKIDSELFPPEEVDRYNRQDTELIEKGIILDIPEQTVTDAHGTAHVYHTKKAPLKDAEGNVTNIVGIMRDITERKRMEQELKRYSEHLEELVEERTGELEHRVALERLLANISSKFVSPLGFEDKINSSVAELGQHIGVDRVYIFESHDGERFASNTFEWCSEGVEPQIQNLQNLESKMFPWWTEKLRNNENIIIPEVKKLPPEAEAEKKILEAQDIVSLLVVPMYSEERLFGFMGFDDVKKVRQWRDEDVKLLRTVAEVITRAFEHYRMEEKLRKAERLAAIGETAAMIGHDLRNPLQSIASTIYLAKSGYEKLPLPSRKLGERFGAVEMFKMIEEQVRYMNKIVTDLHDYSRPLQPQPAEISIPQLINDTLSTVTVPETVKVSVDVEEELKKLMVDPDLMKRLFTNLILNALQSMPKGGQLTIKISKKGEEESISFQDTGTGIPEENLDKLFSPFFTTKAKGQGLGLAVCKRLVEAHGGTISVESKVGEGSTFTVNLPLQQRKTEVS